MFSLPDAWSTAARATGGVWSAEETRYVIFDTAERLRGMDATLLTALLRLSQVQRLEEVEERGRRRRIRG
jgi:hypothetical protein